MKKKLTASLLLAALALPVLAQAQESLKGEGLVYEDTTIDPSSLKFEGKLVDGLYEDEPLNKNGVASINASVHGTGLAAGVTGVPNENLVNSTDVFAPELLETKKGDQAGGKKVASSAAVYEIGAPEADLAEVEAATPAAAAPAKSEAVKAAAAKAAEAAKSAAATKSAAKALPKTSAAK